MEILLHVVICILGLVLLVSGGEVLTRNAAHLATVLGIRPVIIGLTIVAFGTSMPEACVSVFAALDNKSDISVANVVGSNIFNIAFIIGISALIKPLKIELSLIKREVPFAIGSSLIFGLLAMDHVLSRMDGLILFVLFLVFIWVCFRSSPSTTNAHEADVSSNHSSTMVSGFKILLGLALLIIGARLFINGSLKIAAMFSVSELFIGLTIVAVGTSLPELATSVIASIHKKDDIAVGNVVGSNIFNILFILGLSALICPLTVSPAILLRDTPVLIFLSFLSLFFFKTGLTITRTEGFFLVLFQAVYTGFLFQSA